MFLEVFQSLALILIFTTILLTKASPTVLFVRKTILISSTCGNHVVNCRISLETLEVLVCLRHKMLSEEEISLEIPDTLVPRLNVPKISKVIFNKFIHFKYAVLNLDQFTSINGKSRSAQGLLT